MEADYDFEKDYEVVPDLPFAKGEDGYLRPVDPDADIAQSIHGINLVMESVNLPPVKDKRKKPQTHSLKAHCVVFLTTTYGMSYVHADVNILDLKFFSGLIFSSCRYKNDAHAIWGAANEWQHLLRLEPELD